MDLEKYIKDQISVWPLAANNFRALKNVETKEINVGGLNIIVQHNAARAISTNAKLDPRSIKQRKCFLCMINSPKEQFPFPFDGRKGFKYNILVNPYPIFNPHLVIASQEHTPQGIRHRIGDMADLAHNYPKFTFFYNGPYAGASAPDHMHFQACPRLVMPLEQDIDNLLSIIAKTNKEKGVPNADEYTLVPADIQNKIEYVCSMQEGQLYHYKQFTRGVFVFRARTSKSLAKLFYRFLDACPLQEGHSEPLLNLVMWYAPTNKNSVRPKGYTHGLAGFEYRAIVVLRTSHRSSHYWAQGVKHLGVSPGCADMAGYFIVPNKEDYNKINSSLLNDVFNEVCITLHTQNLILWRLMRTQPNIQIVICKAKEICFEIISDGAGHQKITCQDGRLNYNGALYDELFFDAKTISTLFAEASFKLINVVTDCCKDKSNYIYAGALKFVVKDGNVLAINIIGIEDYLLSIMSYDINIAEHIKDLKHKAIALRTTLLQQLQQRQGSVNYVDMCYNTYCYKGLPLAASTQVKEVIDSTWGQVLQ